MTEEDVRRIVREEIAKAKADKDTSFKAFPPQALPMPTYHYQKADWSPAVSSGRPSK